MSKGKKIKSEIPRSEFTIDPAPSVLNRFPSPMKRCFTLAINPSVRNIFLRSKNYRLHTMKVENYPEIEQNPVLRRLILKSKSIKAEYKKYWHFINITMLKIWSRVLNVV